MPTTDGPDDSDFDHSADSFTTDVHASYPRREHVRALRRVMTPAERSFWERVRAHRFRGTKWRRQHPLGPFYADFYCRAWKLVVELDGPVHDDLAVRDAERDAFFSKHRLRVVRVKNDVWFASPDLVLAWLALSFEPHAE